MSQTFFSWILRNRWLTIILAIAAIGGMASGVKHLTFSNDYRMFFSEENPQLKAFEAMQDTYTKVDNVLFVLSPKDGNVFTRNTLDAVEWLTKEAWQVPYSIRVDSISNFQHTEAEEDDLLVQDLVENALEFTAADLEKVRKVALVEPLLVNKIISPDGAHTGINITIQLQGKKLSEVPEVAAFSRDLRQKLSARNPDIAVHLTGMVVMNNAFPEAAKNDVKTLYPAMFGVILLALIFMLRSIPGTASTALILIMSILGTLGLTGWLGIQMSPPTSSVPIMVMTLAVADCVHILVNFLHHLRHGMEKSKAMMESLRINLGPIFLTSLTTIVGFLSLNFSDAPPFRDLGNMAAMGVALAFVLSVTFLPAMMMLLPVKHTGKHTLGHHAMQHLSEWVIHYKRGLFWGVGGIIILLISQVPRNEMNDEFIKYFSENIEFRVSTDYTMDNLTGIYLIEYSLGAGEAGAIAEPEYLQHLDDFANWFRQQPKVMHVNVLTEIMKRLNKNMHGDDPDWYKLPDNRELAAQYLLLYKFSLPFGLDLNNQINGDDSATRMTVTLENLSSEEMLTLDRQAQAWLQENVPAHMVTEGASPSIMFANIGHRNIRSMLIGTTIALIVISIILIIALRSWRIGLISLLPNLVPIGMAFGLWGFFVGQIGLAMSVVSGITIGIVVDDTVHFLSKYLRARRERGLNAEDAIRYAFATVGTALWVTTLVLVLGFSVLSLSDFELNAGMGLLTAIAIAFALFVDFFFLPSLLLKFGDANNEKNTADATD